MFKCNISHLEKLKTFQIYTEFKKHILEILHNLSL
jgi:hypothetical protein